MYFVLDQYHLSLLGWAWQSTLRVPSWCSQAKTKLTVLLGRREDLRLRPQRHVQSNLDKQYILGTECLDGWQVELILSLRLPWCSIGVLLTERFSENQESRPGANEPATRNR